MGLKVTTVYSDADYNAPHVKQADRSYRIGAAPSTDSYLCIDKIIDIALRAGVDAIHPGYGFLSENPQFAAACEAAGLIFIGPRTETIELMGSKQQARKLAIEAGIAVVPGSDDHLQSDSEFTSAAEKIGYPVLLKASAGGGGKGMRVVFSKEALLEAVYSARREAKSAFNNETLLLEKYLENSRHIEFQILGDHHGKIVHLFERECSIQRRYQKIIEESPSPSLSSDLRKKLTVAALKLAKKVNYHNAGTVEFIVDENDQFYFLEMNTRLQVEHPVTECLTGVDLVKAQILVAEGHPLSEFLPEIKQQGAAIECRLYAEIPTRDFLPATGVILDWNLSQNTPVRIDSGVELGDVVSIYYDPMLAKLICHGDTREQARRKMVSSLENLSVLGIETNREFLLALLNHPQFIEGQTTTQFIKTHYNSLNSNEISSFDINWAIIGAALVGHETRRKSRKILPNIITGYRNNRAYEQSLTLETADQKYLVTYRNEDAMGSFHLLVNGEGGDISRVNWSPPVLTFQDWMGSLHKMRICLSESAYLLFYNGKNYTLKEEERFPKLRNREKLGDLSAPMPGQVVSVNIKTGDDVEKGATLLTLEAMKMEHTIKAGCSGKVSQVLVTSGDQVMADQLLVVINKSE
jgi:3-methylcrotonyl-CoA carboxylase alpha subunit